MQTRQLNTLSAGVSATLAKLGDKDGRYFARLIPFAYDFYKDYVADTARENRTVELVVLPDRTAVLPDDYDNYVMVGVRQGQYVRNLVHNPRLAGLPAEYDVEQEVGAVFDTEGIVPQVVLKHSYVGWEGGELEGYAYPGAGKEFRVDSRTRRIVCSSEIPVGTVLLLHYYSFSPDPSEGWVLDPLWQTPLQHYLSWWFYEEIKRDPRQADRYRGYYYTEKGKANRRANPWSLADVNAARADAMHSFPK